MEKKKVLITGASRGIGAACAERFARAGYDETLLCKKNEKKIKELSERLSDRYGIACRTYVGDVGDEEFLSRVFEETGELDVLINNAGISHLGLLSEMPGEAWESLMRTNLTGAYLCCRLAVPGMVRRKQGRIVNVSSVWGRVGASCEVAYSASKGGLDALTKALAKELAPSGISVNAVALGCIDTEMNAGFSAEERAALEEEIPIGRFGTPEEAAEMIYLIAHAPEYLTGEVVGFHGGWMN